MRLAAWGAVAAPALVLGSECSLACALVWVVAWLMVLMAMPGSPWVRN